MQRTRRKPTGQLSAYDLYLSALSKSHDFALNTLEEAIEALDQAVSIDPAYSDAWALKADLTCRLVQGGWRSFEDVGAIGRDAAMRAVEADPDNPIALAEAAFTLCFLQGSVARGLEHARRAVRLHPHSAPVLTLSAVAFNFNAEFGEALAALEQAHRLNPIDPRAFVTIHMVGFAHFFQKRFVEAIRCCDAALEKNSRFTVALRFKAAALAHLGRREEAYLVIKQLLELQPNSSLSISRRNNFGHSWMVDLFTDGLRLAGLPE